MYRDPGIRTPCHHLVFIEVTIFASRLPPNNPPDATCKPRRNHDVFIDVTIFASLDTTVQPRMPGLRSSLPLSILHNIYYRTLSKAEQRPSVSHRGNSPPEEPNAAGRTRAGVSYTHRVQFADSSEVRQSGGRDRHGTGCGIAHRDWRLRMMFRVRMAGHSDRRGA